MALEKTVEMEPLFRALPVTVEVDATVVPLRVRALSQLKSSGGVLVGLSAENIQSVTRLESGGWVGGNVFRSENGREGRREEIMVGKEWELADEGEFLEVGEYFEGEAVAESMCRLLDEGGVRGTLPQG